MEHGKEQTQKSFMKNLAGKPFIIGDGTDICVTFINCKVTKDHYTYVTKYHMNVFSVTNYEDQTCLNHLQKALTDLPTFISKIVLENGTNWTNQLELSKDFWVQIATRASSQANKKIYFRCS